MQVLAWTGQDLARICLIVRWYGRLHRLRRQRVLSNGVRRAAAAAERAMLARTADEGDGGVALGPPAGQVDAGGARVAL
jgi:hypothetical protein